MNIPALPNPAQSYKYVPWSYQSKQNVKDTMASCTSEKQTLAACQRLVQSGANVAVCFAAMAIRNEMIVAEAAEALLFCNRPVSPSYSHNLRRELRNGL